MSTFLYYVLGSSSIWTCRIFEIFLFFPLRLPVENKNKYSIFKIQNSKFDTSKLMSCRGHKVQILWRQKNTCPDYFPMFQFSNFFVSFPTLKVAKMEMVFCYQNCSDLLWEKNVIVIEKNILKFEAEGWEFANILRSLEQFIETVKGQNNFWWQNAFLTCSWRFLRYNKLEQLEFQLEKKIGI